MVGTDWMAELLDMDSLQFDPALLPDDQLQELVSRSSSSSPDSMRAEHHCGADCGCGFALHPLPPQQHIGSGVALPALRHLLRGAQQDGSGGISMDSKSWLPEWPEGMELPTSGPDPLEAVLVQLASPDERDEAAGEPAAAGAATGSPTAASQPHPASAAASPQLSGTAGSAQTHASAGSQRPASAGAAGSASVAAQPAHSGDSAHSAARTATTAAGRQLSLAGESRRQARPKRGSSASPATSDSEGSPLSESHPGSAAATQGKASLQSGWPQGEQRPAAPSATRDAQEPATRPSAALQHAAAKVQSPAQDAQPQPSLWQLPAHQGSSAQVAKVQRRCNELQSHNTQLAGAVQRLTAENAVLRHQLLAVCAATGAAPPAAAPLPAAMPPGFAPPPPSALPGGTPKIPIRKLKPQRPAPASQQPAAGQSARKKLKTAAGATTALLAVFACVMLLSPLAPPGVAGPLQGGQVAPYRSLPAGQALMGGHGRVLTALPPAQLAAANSTHAMAVEVVRGMLNDLTDLEGGGRNTEGGNGSAALALRYNDPVLETLALQRLKELAPLALFSAGEGQALPGGRTFGGVAQGVFAGEGLAAPVACREVFRFDAVSLLHPDFPAARMEAYIDSLTAPKRQRSQALPLLPVGAEKPQGDAASGGTGARTLAGTSVNGGNRGSSGRQQQRGRGRATIGGNEDRGSSGGATGAGSGGGLGGSTLVSMLLPTRNASAQQAGNLTALDQIFVVMAEPSNTYATYSCRLPSPVLV